MARYTAKCWMGSKSGFQDIEVSANTIGGAKEQLQNIYGAEQIINLREVHSPMETVGSAVSMSGGVVIAGIIAALMALVLLTPWILMTIYGGGATWISQKMMKITLSDAADESNTKAVSIILAAAIVAGGIGFVQGNGLVKEWTTPSTVTPTKVAQ